MKTGQAVIDAAEIMFPGPDDEAVLEACIDGSCSAADDDGNGADWLLARFVAAYGHWTASVAMASFCRGYFWAHAVIERAKKGDGGA